MIDDEPASIAPGRGWRRVDRGGLARHLAVALGVGALLALGSGCASTGGLKGRERPPEGPVAAVPVPDEAFPAQLHRVLRDGRPTAERQALLTGVVRRQLARARERLTRRQKDRGVASVVGALYLVRAGELRGEMLADGGDDTLVLALDGVAARGDEGRSAALYELRRFGSAPGKPAYEDASEHLAALETWLVDTRGDDEVGPTERAGREERRAVAKALLLPTDEALQAATKATADWIEAALAFQDQYHRRREAPARREEIVEAVRAMSTGAATMAALQLRHGDAAAAVEAIHGTAADRIAPEGLMQRIVTAARRDDARAWADLLDLFTRKDGRDEETGMDELLVRSAAFSLEVEAFRRDPGSLPIALLLGEDLAALGMGDGAPEVLGDVAEAHPDPLTVGHLLALTTRLVLGEEASDDPESASRAYRAATRLLAVAERDGVRGKTQPSAAQLRVVGARVDARFGELERAKQSLERALVEAPLPSAKRLLATVERRLGHAPRAAQLFTEVAEEAERAGDPLDAADARLALSRVQLDLGARSEAKAALDRALGLVLGARKTVGPERLARAERVLADALDRLGDARGSAAAIDRALSASRGDTREFAVALLDGMALAFSDGDVARARALGKQATSGNLADDDALYLGLWVHFVEKRASESPDGTAASLLAPLEGRGGFHGALAAFASGKIDGAELTRRARTPAERTEAAFYRAVALLVARDPSALPALKEIAAAPTIDLVETELARALVLGAGRKMPGLPPGTLLP